MSKVRAHSFCNKSKPNKRSLSNLQKGEDIANGVDISYTKYSRQYRCFLKKKNDDTFSQRLEATLNKKAKLCP